MPLAGAVRRDGHRKTACVATAGFPTAVEPDFLPSDPVPAAPPTVRVVPSIARPDSDPITDRFRDYHLSFEADLVSHTS